MKIICKYSNFQYHTSSTIYYNIVLNITDTVFPISEMLSINICTYKY